MNEEKHNFPSEGSEEQRSDEASRGERTEEEVEKKPLAEDPGLVGEGSDWETTAQEVRQQPTDEEEPPQEGTQHDEGRKEEDKNLLDKVKDKLKGE
jgi:hypothetical protein